MSFANLKRNKTDLSKLVEQAQSANGATTTRNLTILDSGSPHAIKLVTAML